MTKKTKRSFQATGALLIAIGITLGAFGAHALKEVLSAEQLLSYGTAVDYQLYHGMAILFLPMLRSARQKLLLWSLRMMLTGTFLFSFSIYLLHFFSEMHWPRGPMWVLTPLGGMILIISWVGIFYSIYIAKRNDS